MKKIRFIFNFVRIALYTFYYGNIFLLRYFGKASAFHQLARKWANSLLRISNVKLEIHGLENLDLNKNYIFLSNHISLFDIPVLLSALPHSFRIVYRKSLEKIFYFGYMLKISPYIAIVREDSKNALEGLKQAIEETKKGISVLIYPEGTRSPDGNLGEFKRGGFMLAAKSQKEIVPISIIGTNLILPKGQIEFVKGKVTVYIHKPIDHHLQENFGRKEERQLIADIHSTINSKLI
jgi:1-acyl-sn-glycerol-3-phosphate acyltransferase